MKIDDALRTNWIRQKGFADRLKNEVDQEILGRKRSTWHYESRPKELESFALKIEAGRAANPGEIEDAFACVIVVPNYSEVQDAEAIVTELYGAPDLRRPAASELTTKQPSDFRFDDLRLYVRYQDQGFGPPTGLQGILFEIQIRTFLQHAWTVATHDVVYKAQNVDWRRERVAYQAKAALEQAEVTIESMSALEKSAALPESSNKYDLTNAIIDLLQKNWAPEELPTDIKRLAEGVGDLLRAVRLDDTKRLDDLLSSGRARYGNEHNLDWSPYRAITEYLAEDYRNQFRSYLCNKKARGSVFLYESTLSKLGLDNSEAVRAILMK